MTADRPDDRASEQIKRASDVMYRHANGGLYDPMGLARALSDAGLLATPTDQDNAGLAGRMARIAAIHRDDADDLRAKLERAEDEVDELRATIARVRALHVCTARPDAVFPGTYCLADSEVWPCATIRALDTAGGDDDE